MVKDFNTEGMIPIEKNVTVGDENGREYEPTYQRRAKGLVKSGRARFVADDRICLLCPPEDILEENTLSDNTVKVKTEGVNPTVEHVMSIAEKFMKDSPAPSIMSIEYIIEKINQIIDDKKHIYDSIDALRNFKNSTAPDGGVGDAHKAEALGNIVRHREQTNQQLLKILEKMLDHHINMAGNVFGTGKPGPNNR